MPSHPIWYGAIADEIRRYILEKQTGPLLLTGYGHFGGTFLLSWAAKKASEELAVQSRVDNSSIIRIETDLTRGDRLVFQLRKWLIDVGKLPEYAPIRRQSPSVQAFAERVTDLYAEDEIIERGLAGDFAVSGTLKSPANVAPAEFSIKLDKGKREITRKMIPRDLSEQVFNELQKVALSLPAQPRTGLLGVIDRVRKRGPYRLLLVVDKLDDWRAIDELFHYVHIGESLRLIAIVDKHELDRWCAEPGSEEILRRRYNIVECAPLFDSSIAQELLDHWFDVPHDVRRKRSYREFVDGLDFVCGGSPGAFNRIFSGLWTSSDETLELSPDFLDWARNLGRFQRILSRSWDMILLSRWEQSSKRIPNVRSNFADERQLVHRMVRFMTDSQGFTIDQLHRFAVSSTVEKRPFMSETQAIRICDTLIQLLETTRLISVDDGDIYRQ